MVQRVSEPQLGLLDQPGLNGSHASGLSLHIRESTRARRLILQVRPPGILEVVVPRGTRGGEVQAFVASNREWIDAARRSLRLERPPEPPDLPHELRLEATGDRFRIRYRRGANRVRLRAPDRLEVTHAGSYPAEATVLLRRWLLARGRDVLKPWLAAEADRLRLEPRTVQVRLQRTRWGSCSSRGNISLNAALLLVPPELLRYLLVHELCHLVHLNHSPRYWAQVRRFEPDYPTLDRRLAGEWERLPGWLFDSLYC
jgi:predicted metal-dependent hydrolase